jgi:hypothetical protein
MKNSKGTYLTERRKVDKDMDGDQNEQIEISLARIASAFEGIYNEIRRAGIRYWPSAKEQKQAVLSRVESDDERARRSQGARLRTVAEVIDPTIDDEIPDDFLGERTRQWLRDHPQEARKDASTEAATGGKPDGAGVEAAEDQTGNVSGGSPDIPNHKVVRKGRV